MAASPEIPTLSTVIHADRALGPERLSQPISVLPVWAPKPMVRSYALLPQTDWLDSSQLSV